VTTIAWILMKAQLVALAHRHFLTEATAARRPLMYLSCAWPCSLPRLHDMRPGAA